MVPALDTCASLSVDDPISNFKKATSTSLDLIELKEQTLNKNGITEQNPATNIYVTTTKSVAIIMKRNERKYITIIQYS